MPSITPLTPEQFAIAKSKAQSEPYWVRVLIGFDIFANVILGGNADETISSRSARAATEGKLWGRVLSRFLNLFQRDHGALAEAGDVKRAEDALYLEDASGNLPDTTASSK